MKKQTKFGYKSLAELKNELDIDWSEEGMVEAYEPSEIVTAFDSAMDKHDGNLTKVAATLGVPMTWVKALVKFDDEAKAAEDVLWNN